MSQCRSFARQAMCNGSKCHRVMDFAGFFYWLSTRDRPHVECGGRLCVLRQQIWAIRLMGEKKAKQSLQTKT